MSVLENLKSVVSKVAPLLGSALGSPLAGVALSFISNSFGDKNGEFSPEQLLAKITSDPDAAVKLKEIEMKHETELRQIAFNTYQAQLNDIQNARAAKNATEQFTGKKDWLIPFLVLAAVGLFGFCLFAAWFSSGSANQIFIYLIGQQSGVYLSVYAFYFSGIDPKKIFDDVKNEQSNDAVPTIKL